MTIKRETSSSMQPDAAPRSASLPVRLAVMLSIALLPLGLLAVLQSIEAIREAQDTYRESLAAQTTRAAQPEAETIVRAFGLARGLGNSVPSLLRDPDRCVQTMRRTVARNEALSFAGFIGLDQTSVCNSFGRFFDFGGNPENDRVFEARQPDVTFNPDGEASGRAVVIVSQPVFQEDGIFIGFLSLSFMSNPLVESRAEAGLDEAVTLVTFNSQGDILTSDVPRDDVAGLLPADADLAAFAGQGQPSFSARGDDGVWRDYAVAPILPGEAYALGIWESPRLVAEAGAQMARSAALPIMMWLASLVVANMAMRRQVIVPIRQLRMRMRDFAEGRAIFRADTDGTAARELQEIELAFERMASRLIRDEAELEDKVHEREVLLREVHHRVKNNLQLMSSIINMQIRQTRSDEAGTALRRVQGRLASLAKFHQDLYETSSLSRLRADQLIEDLARQMVSMSSDPLTKVDLRLDFDEVVLVPDQASPLAMLVTEALTNALKYAGRAADGAYFIGLSMKSRNDAGTETVTVVIENSVSDEAPAPTDSGLGTRLIQAFASQLEGAMNQGPEEGRYVVRVAFTRAEPADGAEGDADGPAAERAAL